MPVYTVKRNGDVILSHELQAYRALMDEWQLPLAPDRRVPQPDGSVLAKTDFQRLCIWDSQNDAQRFCDELKARTRVDWIVTETDEE